MKEKVVIVMPIKNEANNIKDTIEELKKIGFRKIVVGLDIGTIDNTADILEKEGIYYNISNSSGYDPSVHAALNQQPPAYVGGLL